MVFSWQVKGGVCCEAWSSCVCARCVGVKVLFLCLLAPMPWVGKTVLLLCRFADQTNEFCEWSHCCKLYQSVGKVGLDEGCNLFK